MKPLFLFLLLCYSLFLFSQEGIQHTLCLPFFLVIESSESTSPQIKKAMQSILDMGHSVLPGLQARFEETKNPHYFYLLEKLKNTSEKKWSKIQYFQGCYKKAKELFHKGKLQEGLKIAQAILVLEPNLEFRKEIENFISKCKISAKNTTDFTATIQFSQTFYSFGEDILVEFHLKNSQAIPLLFVFSKNHGIVLQIRQKDHFLEGMEKIETKTKLVACPEEIYLAPGAKRIFSFRLSNPKPPILLYRVWEISAFIPRCRVSKEGKNIYPKISFQEKKISSLPKEFSYLLRKPLNSCLWAISLGYEKHLFFASFFLSSQEKSQVISHLIEALEYSNALAIISFGILKRFTKQNFASRTEWQNWWQARSTFWKD